MRLADYVIQFLEDLNIGHVFTVTGGGSIVLCDALGQSKKLKYVACHHEQTSAMAAEAYARVSGGIGVTLVTLGPGATNTITGVAGSWLDHVPHLIISGQSYSKQTIQEKTGLRTFGVQEIDIVTLVGSISKYAVMVKDPGDIRYHLEKAVYLAKYGRPGPVWLDIPADVQNAQINPGTLKGFNPEECSTPIDAEFEAKVAEVAKLMMSARRPLIHVGQGVRLANAESEFAELVECYGLPFVTARNANDIMAFEHPLLVGRPGTFGQRGANFAVQTADFYLAIGTRLSLSQTGFNAGDYARNAKVVMVDIDQAELNKDTVKLHLKIQADARVFLSALLKQLDKQAIGDLGSWRERCQTWKQKYPPVLPEYRSQKESVNSYHFIDVLSDVATKDDIIVTDMGFSFQNTHQAFKVKKGQRMFTNCGLASMGWGLPAAIGACFGGGKRRTICLAGDGGFMMNLQEMATVFHHQLPIKIFILNNGGYSTIKQTQELGLDGRLMGVNHETGLSFPDFQLLAQAFGFKRALIKTHDDLKEQIEGALSSDEPMLCEVIIDPNQLQAPRAINRRDSSGRTKQTPLEDSFPFLSEEEINQNMEV